MSGLKQIFLNIIGCNPKTNNPKSMTLIKNKSDLDYVLMDALLIIIGQKGGLSVSELQYELLSCGLMVQQPLIRDALKELREHRAIEPLSNLN